MGMGGINLGDSFADIEKKFDKDKINKDTFATKGEIFESCGTFYVQVEYEGGRLDFLLRNYTVVEFVYNTKIPQDSDLFIIRDKFISKYGVPDKEQWIDIETNPTEEKQAVQGIGLTYNGDTSASITIIGNTKKAQWGYFMIVRSQSIHDKHYKIQEECVKREEEKAKKKKAESVKIPD